MSGFKAGEPHLRLVEKERNLQAVPNEGESLNDFIYKREKRFQRVLNAVSGSIEEAHDLAACERTLNRLLARADFCKAEDRAAYLETAIECISEARRAK